MDMHRLIAEVRQWPALWDSSHADHSNRLETQRLWNNVAEVLGCNVDLCRAKWKNLRCSYRRHNRRQSLSKQQPSPSPVHQWSYAEEMDFLGNMQRRDSSTNEEDDGEAKKDAASDSGMSFKRETMPADEMEADNDALMQEFQNMATPQALRRLSQSISLASAAAEERSMPQQASPSPSTSGFGFGQGLGQGLGHGIGHGLGLGMGMNIGTAMAAAAVSSCQCAKRVDEQVNFLEGLKREEQQLMQSTSQDLARCKNVLHVGDSDYNYLISFMPLMKQMTPIQNVFFRAKMGELLLQTMHQQPPVQLQQQQQQMMLQHQQQRQQQQPQQQQQQQEESQPSQMLLNQQQMALDQAELQ
ncbi:TPR-containing protein [Drosophila madeirensis]|uniref:TPR-containing protein n=1 Tax=Drosophila madeirensis TaxID=30013 RepID=A0AAU9FS41_DROMD